jgi:hypothetical protein
MTTELTKDAGRELPDLALLQAIRPSASRMAAGEEAFVRLLHEEIEPLVRRLPDGGWPLCERTARAVLWLTLSDPPADAVIMWMHWLGEKNQADGFPPSEYVRIGHALVWIAREMSGTKWSTTTGSAWIRFFMWLQPLLQAGARRPTALQSRATFQEHPVPQQRPSFHPHAVPQQQAAPQEHALPQQRPTFHAHAVPQQQAAPQTQPTSWEQPTPQEQPVPQEQPAPQEQAASQEQAAPQTQPTSWEQPTPQEQPAPQEHAAPQEQAAPLEQTAPLEEHRPETVPQQAAPVHEAASPPAADTDVSPSAGLSAGEDEPTPVHDQAVPDKSAPPRATSSTRRQARQRPRHSANGSGAKPKPRA